MDHNDLIRSLPSKAKARLLIRTDKPGLRHLALYLAALALTGTGIALHIPYWPLLLLPHGILLVFLFTLSHECTHQTAFATPWLNALCGHAIAPLLGLPFIWFRYFHMAHHKYTNDPARDPEITAEPRPATWGQWLSYISGVRYWRAALPRLWANALGRLDAPYLPPRRHRAMQHEARLILALYALAALSLYWSPVLIWLWLVPVLIGQPFLRAYLLAEHGACPPVADMLENTRTTFTNRAIRFLAWNMPYHIEHHSLPNVPFHQLPALHALMRAHLKTTAPGYAAFTARYARSLNRER